MFSSNARFWGWDEIYVRDRIRICLRELMKDLNIYFGEESPLLSSAQGIVDELQKATDEAVPLHNPTVRPTVRLQHGFVPVIIIFYSLEC